MGAQSYSQWELLLLDNGQEKESYSYNMHMVKTEATQLMQLDIASLFKSALLFPKSHSFGESSKSKSCVSGPDGVFLAAAEASLPNSFDACDWSFSETHKQQRQDGCLKLNDVDFEFEA